MSTVQFKIRFINVIQIETDRVYARKAASSHAMCNNPLEVVSGQYTNGAPRMLCTHFKWNLHVQRFTQFYLIEILAQSPLLFHNRIRVCFMNPQSFYFRFSYIVRDF